jgi:hypothetical protein
MKIKIYLLSFAVALVTFVFGVAVAGGFYWLQSFFQTPQGSIASFSADEIIAPLPVAGIMTVNSAIEEQKKIVTPETVSETETVEEPEFDASGEYYAEEGKLPKGFRDFEYLEITARDYTAQSDEFVYGVPIPPKGSIHTKKNYKFTRISIGAKQIAFETEKIDGVSYRFTGKFPENELCEYNGEGQLPNLKGRLVKIKDGKKIAETDAEFYISCGC